MDVSRSIRFDVSSLTVETEHENSPLYKTRFEDCAAAMPPLAPNVEKGLPSRDDAEHDIEVMLASFGLQSVRRYMNQLHWHEESRLAQAADNAEPGLKLENVAAHSWHVADAIMLLAPHFPEIDARHALQLAILHDKLELFTGDFDPVGPDGDGSNAHVFDTHARAEKTAIELAALEHYLAQLRPSIRIHQRKLFLESIYSTSSEARFVKAVDKLQALSFVLAKKAGTMTDGHLVFSLRYSAKTIEYFPKLTNHYLALVRRLVHAVASYRHMPPSEVVSGLPAAVRPIAVAADE